MFLSNLLKFKIGYKINEQDIFENLDAVLIGEVHENFRLEYKIYIKEFY